MTETNLVNLEKAKKLGDEHQELYKLLSDENLENTSLVFFDPEIKIPSVNYFDTINNLANDKIYDNKLYLPGIKIENNKVFTEQELGKTVSTEIFENDIPFRFCNPTYHIFKLYKKESSDIPQEILNSIKQIELLEVQIVKEKNKILNSNYVKDKLNYKFENINEYLNSIIDLGELRDKNLI